eukprot:12296018-Heterocapsa_arctica.AAC.1
MTSLGVLALSWMKCKPGFLRRSSPTIACSLATTTMAVPVPLMTASWMPGGIAPSASLVVMKKEAPNSHSAGLARTC